MPIDDYFSESVAAQYGIDHASLNPGEEKAAAKTKEDFTKAAANEIPESREQADGGRREGDGERADESNANHDLQLPPEFTKLLSDEMAKQRRLDILAKAQSGQDTGRSGISRDGLDI